MLVWVDWDVDVSGLEHPWVQNCSYYKDMMTDDTDSSVGRW